jgi:glycolate oxidase iron-sulfur subunit
MVKSAPGDDGVKAVPWPTLAMSYIDLMRAVKEKRLAVDSLAFETHIDRCLGCRACESACPAGVEYGHLLEAARAEIVQGKTKPTGFYRLFYFGLKHVWSRPGRLRAAFALARLMRDSGFARLLLRTGFARSISKQFEFGLELLEASGGTSTALSVGDPPAGAQAAGVPVMLFKGCVGEGLFKRVNEATMRVLTVNGCDAQAPELPRRCCDSFR